MDALTGMHTEQTGATRVQAGILAGSPWFAGVFVAVCFETLFSVPYRTVHLATHAAGKSWIAALLGLLFVAWFYRRRRATWAALAGLGDRLPPIWLSPWATLAAGAALRLLWVFLFHPPLASDGAGYFTEATHLAKGHFYEGTFWPPGFPLFLTPFLSLLGAHFYVAVLVGFLLFATTILLTRLVALQVTASRRAAAVAGWVVSLWPGHITVVGINCKEAMIAVLMTGVTGLLYCTRTWTGRRLWLAMAGTGILAGMAALTQPGTMLFPSVIFLAEWILTRRFSAALLRTLVAGVAMVVTILPWTVRNYVATGRVVAISSNGGSVFYRANNPNANASYSSEGEVVLPKDTIAADREGYAMAKEWITHHPLAFAALAIRKQVVFLGDDGDGVYEGLKRNRHPSTVLYAGLKSFTSLYWFLLWLGLLCCCRTLFRAADWPVWFAVAFLPFLYQWGIDSVFESGSRHHLAHVGCLAVLCAGVFSVLEGDQAARLGSLHSSVNAEHTR